MKGRSVDTASMLTVDSIADRSHKHIPRSVSDTTNIPDDEQIANRSHSPPDAGVVRRVPLHSMMRHSSHSTHSHTHHSVRFQDLVNGHKHEAELKHGPSHKPVLKARSKELASHHSLSKSRETIHEFDMHRRRSSHKSATKARESGHGIEAYPHPVLEVLPSDSSDTTQSSTGQDNPMIVHSIPPPSRRRGRQPITKRVRHYVNQVWARPWFRSEEQREEVMGRENNHLPPTDEDGKHRNSETTLHQ